MFFKKKKNKDFYETIIEMTEQNKEDLVAVEINKIKNSIKNVALYGGDSLHEYISAPKGKYEVIKQEIRKLGFKVEESSIKDIYISWEDGVKAEFESEIISDFFVVLEDTEGCGPKIHALCTTQDKANKIKNNLVEEMTEECFEADPKESGLDEKLHKEQITKECEQAFKIIGIKEINRILRKDDVVNAEENCN